MRFDLNLIFKFFKTIMKLTKKTIAKEYFFCSSSKLSKENNITAEQYYEILFNVENSRCVVYRKDKAAIFDALKQFMGEIEEAKTALSGIWNEEYEKFVLEMLSRAIAQSAICGLQKNNRQDEANIKSEATRVHGIADVIEFSETFDMQMIELDSKIYFLNNLLNRDDLKRNDIPVREFEDVFEKAVLAGKNIVNPIGLLRSFINELDGSFVKWELVVNKLEPYETEFNAHLLLLFRDIREIVFNYLRFRDKYLLEKEFDIPEDATNSKQMLAIFNQAIRRWNIDKLKHTFFISPAWVDNFATMMLTNIEQNFEYRASGVIYEKIIEFTCRLKNYILIAGQVVSSGTNIYYKDLFIEDQGDSEFIINLKRAAQSEYDYLISLFNEIQSMGNQG